VAERLATVIENSKLYDRMRERDRLAALGEMAAGLAHEIRNPLGAIKGAAQCLDPGQHTGEDGEFLEVIVEEVNRLNGVVTQFLDYARPMKQSFGPTDLNEVVTRTVKLVVNEVPKDVELKVELAETLPKVSADAEQLKQVLINLVQNAVQALLPGGGKISLRTFGPERFSDFRGSDWVQLEVVDDGPGIPADQQEHIFVPFYTTKQKGTGLGLAICQRIVKNHGGSISVQSKSSEGTSFVIRLPPLPSDSAPELPADGTPFPGTVTPPLAAKGETSSPPPSRRDRRRRRA
jgi:signal transduction histidine kinase